MNALNKLIQERFADITQGASADVYPLTTAEIQIAETQLELDAKNGLQIGTDRVDDILCALLNWRK